MDLKYEFVIVYILTILCEIIYVLTVYVFVFFLNNFNFSNTLVAAHPFPAPPLPSHYPSSAWDCG